MSKYHGKYIATPSFNDRTIVAYGEDAGKVFEEARSKGHAEPVVVFCRDPEITYIY